MSNPPSFNDHLVVDFAKLVHGDSNEINLLQNEFETNGWCFIRLPHENNQLDEVQKSLSTFFSQDQSKKSEYISSDAFGYSCVGHKEGIRVLINEEGLQKFHHRLPNDIEQTLEYLSKQSYYLTNILKSIILKMVLLSESPSKDVVSLSPLSMLDIVKYLNERTGPIEQPPVGLNTNEVNCVPHFDPGLFSLSILSTCDGLQLKDRLHDQWFDGPSNSEEDQRSIGVIWLGEAASTLTQDRFKTGIHRVLYPRIKHQSRLTIWQEICTQSQIGALIQNNEKSMIIPDNTDIQMLNQPNSIPLHVQSGGETLKHFLNRVEDQRGIPMSKSGVEHLQIKFPVKVNKKPSFFSRLFKK